MKNSFVIDNIGSVSGPAMKPKILRGLSEQLILKNVFWKKFHLSLAGWLHSRTCRPPELPVHDLHTHKHRIYPGKLKLLPIKAYVLCPKCFYLCKWARQKFSNKFYENKGGKTDSHRPFDVLAADKLQWLHWLLQIFRIHRMPHKLQSCW